MAKAHATSEQTPGLRDPDTPMARTMDDIRIGEPADNSPRCHTCMAREWRLVGLACLALLGACVRPAPSDGEAIGDLTFRDGLTTPVKPPDLQVPDKVVVLYMLKRGDSLDSWNEIGLMGIYAGQTQANDFIRTTPLVTSYKNCPATAKTMTITPLPSEPPSGRIMYEAHVQGCPPLPDYFQFGVGITGVASSWQVAYGLKGGQPTQAQLDAWTKDLLAVHYVRQ